jgi:hypothetical protein
MFKVGDKVYNLQHSWGEVTIIDTEQAYPIIVCFDNNEMYSFTKEGRVNSWDKTPTLSFTEYTLEGFSQEKPIELPKVGEEVMVSDDGMTWRLAIFHGTNPTSCKYPYHTSLGSIMYFKRLK